MKNKFETFLFKTMLVLIPVAALALLTQYSVHKLADYIYSITAAPFLR